MKKILNHIISIAGKDGLHIKTETIKPLESTGFMSKIFSAETDRGKTVIHVVSKPVSEQEYQDIPKKVSFVSQLLKNIPQVPKVYLVGHLPQRGYFIIQEYKPGKPLGRRIYKDGRFVDELLADNPNPYLTELQKIVLHFHEFEGKGFGYCNFSQNDPNAKHNSWEEFLLENFNRNLQILQKSQEKNRIQYFSEISLEKTQEQVQTILENNKEMFEIEKARFIHGDVFNYSNVLISEKGIEGIIDFEWSIFGHPAWEFVFSNPPLDVYLPMAIKAGLITDDFDFRRSIELHNIFWCAWGASVHADNPEFGPAIFKVFLDSLKNNS